ncbi:MAG: CBS domain-containing protein [Holosporales bacterium]|jgi:CBS domain containing-hemolysin-like protein|nr:CBS domain-containing protein [Holosporales bacterium]
MNNRPSDLIEKRTVRQCISGFLKKLWKMSLGKEQDSSIRDAIEELIEEEEEDEEQSIDNDEKMILVNVLSLKDLTAEDIMIPYANIAAIPLSASPSEVSAIFMKANVSQVPVYSGTIDNIVGLLCLKDALGWINGKSKVTLKSILKEILYIAPTMRILDLLLQMREIGVRLAIVVDEYGGVAGMVTFALLIESIVGNVQYEDDNHSEEIEMQQNGTVILSAGTPLDELDASLEKICGKHIDWLKGLDDEDIDTIGGLATFLAGRVPMRGELILHPLGFELEILEADPRRVKKIAIRNIAALQQVWNHGAVKI